MHPGIRHGMVLPFQPVTLTFRDVHYFVDMPAVRCSASISLRTARPPMSNAAVARQDNTSFIPFLVCCSVADIHRRSMDAAC